MMALKFSVVAECAVSKARASRMELPHSIVDTPVFMPVGTQGTMKGVTPDQLISPTMDCRILLSNTYHLANRPVIVIISSNIWVIYKERYSSTECPPAKHSCPRRDLHYGTLIWAVLDF